MTKQDLAFVGQAPSATSDPLKPLSGKSGLHLADLLGLDFDWYLSYAHRFNLNGVHVRLKPRGDSFDAEVGKLIAFTLRNQRHLKRFVLLGKKVCDCFGVPWQPLHIWESADQSFFCLPHPSGINQWYNAPNNRAEAERRLRLFCS